MFFGDKKSEPSVSVNRKVILSGMQSSGGLHIGNYFGALKYFLRLCRGDDVSACYFMIADIHALNILPEPAVLRQNTIDLAAALVGCGLDEAVLFCQSSVPYHTELSVYLSSISSLGRLERMTQFKDKSQKGDRDSQSLGLLYYPVLQAADILLYKADLVPVGVDQSQHLELTKYLAQKFNSTYGRELFTSPEAVLNPNAERIMSLLDGKKKMSKSDPAVGSCINLTDSDDTILAKVKGAKTDSIQGVSYDQEGRPEISNLLRIFSNCTGRTYQEIADEYQSASTKDFKLALADALVSVLSPIREKILQYSDDKAYLLNKLRSGNIGAMDASSKTIDEVRSTIGLLRF